MLTARYNPTALWLVNVPMARPAPRSSIPLPPRMQRLLREARALLVGFAALLLAAILLTHTVADPGFSTTGDSAALHNVGRQHRRLAV